MAKTIENLKAAFAGESQANRRYLAFAKAAEKEGKKGLAKLFRAAAEGETIHALNHFRAMGGVKSSLENLKSAIEGEGYEIEKMYPQFIDEAKKEGKEEAAKSFDWANKVEKIHENLFKQALAKLEKGEDIEEKEYFVCKECGYLAVGKAPEKCPVCGSPKKDFYKIK
jgi:rubrerythrin